MRLIREYPGIPQPFVHVTYRENEKNLSANIKGLTLDAVPFRPAIIRRGFAFESDPVSCRKKILLGRKRV